MFYPLLKKNDIKPNDNVIEDKLPIIDESCGFLEYISANIKIPTAIISKPIASPNMLRIPINISNYLTSVHPSRLS